MSDLIDSRNTTRSSPGAAQPDVRERIDSAAIRPLRGDFLGVQALRGVAAMLVVAMHTDQMWHLRLDPNHSLKFWESGAAGVDIFFVISGFVMLVATPHLVAVRGWREFVRRRLERIVPLYWATTVLKLVSVAAAPSLALHTVLRPGAVIASFLFLPWHNPERDISPLLPVGWTLNLEMGFYLLFACALASGFGVLPVVLPCLAVLAAASVFVTPDWPGIAAYCDPIVLEFGAGLCLGALTLRGRRLPTVPAAIALVAGFVLLLFVPQLTLVLPRLLCWGAPALLIVCGAVGLETYARRMCPRWLLALGNASYSIYLIHSLLLAALGAVLQKLPASPAGSYAGTLVIGLLLSAGVGLLCHWAVERPLLAACKRLRRAGAPANPAAVLP